MVTDSQANELGENLQRSDKKPLLVLGVTGSVAIYKVCDLIQLIGSKVDTVVVMTRSARRFVSPLTFRVLTGRHVLTDLFDEKNAAAYPHVDLANRMHALLIAPATANLLGKLSNGLADDLLSTLALSVSPLDKPCLIAPAMNPSMYEHPTVQQNLSDLINQGYTIIPMREGHLSCGAKGIGRVAKVDVIAHAVYKSLDMPL